ncbi:DUF4007 family protein [Clostridium botulinum]|nr:DUF4007 family protein [Clostridium botulinum]NFP02341.1 DUF4007 family protein [Clostridium botulinum]
MSSTSIKLRGHESFYIREGWLRKGVNAIKDDSYLLSNLHEAIDTIGVGSAMVKSIRYWLQAVGICEETRGEKRKRQQKLTENFGEDIFQYDPYFEDLGTLYLLHYKLVTNKELATSWYLFFNEFKPIETTKMHMEEIMKQLILNIDPEMKISDKSLNDDCNCIIKTYYAEKNDLKNPEDNMICPFTDLGLLKKVSARGKEDIILKISPNRKKLDKLIVLFVILENLNKGKSTTIRNLIEDNNNIGKVFNLNKNLVNYYVDELEEAKFINVTRTAGLNTIYPTDKATDILHKYYSQL